MRLRALVAGTLVGLGLLAGAITIAQNPPVQNIDPKRNPNLAAAQRLVDQAYDRISAAQRGNEFDMQGHAARAKDLLDQVNRELKQAAEARDHERH